MSDLNTDSGCSLDHVGSSPPSPSIVVFDSVKDRYGIGESVHIRFKKVDHFPTKRDWVGVFPSDSVSSENPSSFKYVPNLIVTEHGADIGVQVASQIRLVGETMRLELDFPVDMDSTMCEIRYVTESKTVIGKTNPFAVLLVPSSEHSDVDDAHDACPSATFEAGDLGKRLAEEIERREQAEKAVENCSRTLGTQMNTLEERNAIISDLRSNFDSAKVQNEIQNDESQEIREQYDNLIVLYERSQANVVALQTECTRLGKELEVMDKENSCLKFHFVNSDEKMDNVVEEYVVRKDSRTNWTGGGAPDQAAECATCKSLTRNNEILEAALEEEREKCVENEAKMDEIMKAYLDMNIEKEHLHHMNDHKEAKLEELETNLAERESLYCDQLNTLETELATLNQKLQSEKEISDELEEGKKRTEQELKNAGDQLSKMGKEIDKLEGENEKMKKEKEAASYSVSKLEKEVTRLEESSAKYTDQLESCELAHSEELKKREQEFSERYLAQEEIRNSLLLELDESNGIIMNERESLYCDKLNTLETELATLNQRLQSEKHISDELQEGKKRMQQELRNANDLFTKMGKEIEKLKGENEKMGKEMETASYSVSKLEKEVTKLEESSAKYTNQLESSHSEELKKREQEFSERYSAQEKIRNSLLLELDKSNGRISELQIDVDAKTKASQEAVGSAYEIIEHEKSLGKDLKEEHALREKEYTNKIAENKKTIAEYKEKVRELETKLEKTKCQLIEMMVGGDETKEREEKSSSEEESVCKTTTLKAEYDSVLGQLKDERQSRRETDKAYERQIEELESRVANESSNASRLENDLATSELRCREYEEDVRFFRQQLLDTEKKLQDGQCALSKMMEEMNNMKNKARRSSYEDIPPPTAASTPLCSQNTVKNNHLKTVSFENLTRSDEISSSKSVPASNSTFTVIQNPLQQQQQQQQLNERNPVPGMIKYNPNQHDDIPQPISVIIEGRKVPKKKGRRFSKPINIGFPHLNTVSELHHDFEHGHQHHHQHQQHVSTPYPRHVERQSESQYDAVRQHRNSLLRENTYLKNKVSALVTDLLLMQKNLQDVVADAEQKLSMLHLAITNQYVLTNNVNAHNELPAYHQILESTSSVGSDVDGSYNNGSTAGITGVDSYLSQYGVIQSPMKPLKERMSSKLSLNEPNVKCTPIMCSLSTPSPNFLSPLAEEYTPANANNMGRHLLDGHVEHQEISVDSSASSDVYVEYVCEQNNELYTFPPHLPPTPTLSEDGLIDVTRQLENIGIRL